MYLVRRLHPGLTPLATQRLRVPELGMLQDLLNMKYVIVSPRMAAALTEPPRESLGGKTPLRGADAEYGPRCPTGFSSAGRTMCRRR